MIPAPEIRVRDLGDRPERTGRYVLYWMVASRRPRWSFALQQAAERADALGQPLVILEALRVGYPWASDRLHRFILDGMRAHEAYFRGKNVVYLPYLEPERGAGRGLLKALADDASLVVSDDYPCFFIPRMQEAAARKISAPLELVDGNGLLPMRAASKSFSRAFDFRRFLQKSLPAHLETLPLEDPLEGLAPLPRGFRETVLGDIRARWPAPSAEDLAGETLGSLPIDHSVPTACL